MTTLDKLARARTTLVLDHPFFGILALRLRLLEAKGIGTMGVDGKAIHFDPSFVDELEFLELVGVVAHKVLHVALLHPFRRGERDHKRWNDACDYAINQILIDAGFKLPEDRLLDSAYAGLSAEEIYARLPQGSSGGDNGGSDSGGGDPDPSGDDNPDPNGDSSEDDDNQGQCPWGIVMDAPPEDGEGKATQAELQRQAAEWLAAATQAAAIAKRQGNLPDRLESMIEEIKQPSVPWQAVLRRYLEAIFPSDYSWSRPNRRHIANGLYLPSVIKDGTGELVVAVDTSGSVSDAELTQFAGELSSIVADVKPSSTHVIYCDAGIAEVQTYGPGDAIAFSAKGRGGTSFRPPFEWVAENGIVPKCFIYLTDLEGDFPDEPPYPVIWASLKEGHEAPFGNTVFVETQPMVT